MLWVFQKKKKEFYKEKCGTVKKKECKKRYRISQKMSVTKVFQVCISIVYDSLFAT